MSAATIDVGVVQAYLRLRDELTPALELARQQMGKFGREMQAFGRQMADAGAGLTKLAAPILLVGGYALKAAIDFEHAFAGVRKTMKATEPEFAVMSAGFRKLSTEIPITAVELARIGMIAGQLGIEQENVLGFVETMAKLGSTTTMSSDDAAVALARFTNIMGTAQSESNKLGSALVALGNDGASTEQEIVEMALRIAGAGKTIGMTEGDVLGLANALSSVGIHAELGGSAISRVMIRIAKAVNDGGAELTEFAKVAKLSNEAYQELFNKDSGQAVAAFLSGLTKIKAEGGNLLNTLEKLDFTEIRVRDTLLRVANAGDLVTESMNLGNKAFAEGTELNRSYGEMTKTTAAQLKILWNQLTDVAVEMGGAFLPLIKDAIALMRDWVPVIREVAIWFGDLPTPVKLVAGALAALFVAAGPVVFVLGQLIFAGGQIASALGVTGAAGSVKVLTSGLWLMQAAMVAILGVWLGWRIGTWSRDIEIFGATIGEWVPILWNWKLGLAGISLENLKVAETSNRALESMRQLEQLKRENGISGKRTGDINLPAPPPAPSTGGAGSGPTSFAALTAQLKEAEKAMKALSATQKNDLSKAILSGAFDMETLKEKTGLSDIALKLFTDRVKDHAKAAEDAAKKQADFEKSVYSFGKIVSGSPVAALTTFKDVIDGTMQLNRDFSYELMASQVEVDAFGNVIRVNLQPSLKGAGADLREAASAAHTFAGELKEGLKEALMGIPALLKSAFTGGGGLLGALKALAVDIAEVFGKTLSDALKKSIDINLKNYGSGFTANGARAAGGLGALTGVGAVASGASTGQAIGAVAMTSASVGITAATMGASTTAAIGLGLATFGIGTAAVFAAIGIRKLLAATEETKKVKPLRDEFFRLRGELETLNPQIKQATGSFQLVQDLFNAKTEQDAVAAMDAIDAALELYREKLALAETAIGDLTTKTQHLIEVTPAMRSALDAAFRAETIDEFNQQLGILGGLMDDQIQKQEFLEETMEKYGISWTSLGEKAKNAKVAEIAKGITDEFDVLLGAGVDINEILRAMGPNINDFVQQAKKSGAEVPENFRRIIQHAIDAGEVFTVSTEELEKMREEAKKLGKPFDEAKFKIKEVEEAGLKFGTSQEQVQIEIRDAMIELARVLRETLGSAFKDVAKTAVTELNKIPKEIDIDVDVHGNYKLPKNIPNDGYTDEGPGFAFGTGGKYLDFGPGTKVTLHGRERVKTESEGQAETAKLDAILSVLQAANSGGGAPTTVVDLGGAVILDGASFEKFLDDHVWPQQPSAILRDIGGTRRVIKRVANS